MIVKNLTSKVQKIEVKEIAGDHNDYDIYLEPLGCTDLDSHLILDINKYAGIIEIAGLASTKKAVKVVAPVPVVEEPTEVIEEEVIPVEEATEEIVEEEKKESEEKEKKNSDSFICDVCGAEFASARGLASHKNKAHSE